MSEALTQKITEAFRLAAKQGSSSVDPEHLEAVWAGQEAPEATEAPGGPTKLTRLVARLYRVELEDHGLRNEQLDQQTEDTLNENEHYLGTLYAGDIHQMAQIFEEESAVAKREEGR